MPDVLTALREAEYPVDLLTEAQRSVLATLTEQETAVLISVQQRLRAADGEVTGQEWKML